MGYPSKWVMKVSGYKFSWTSKVTQIDPPKRMAWKSTSGLQNVGVAVFEKLSEGQTKLTISLEIKVPWIVAKLVGKSNWLRKYIKKEMIDKSVIKYREIIIEELKHN